MRPLGAERWRFPSWRKLVSGLRFKKTQQAAGCRPLSAEVDFASEAVDIVVPVVFPLVGLHRPLRPRPRFLGHTRRLVASLAESIKRSE